jgi:hypothetical protein
MHWARSGLVVGLAEHGFGCECEGLGIVWPVDWPGCCWHGLVCSRSKMGTGWAFHGLSWEWAAHVV